MPKPRTTEQFLKAWKALSSKDRRRIRQLVRFGWTIENRKEAALAADYARYLQTRAWARRFWLWYPFVLMAALLAAAQIHPIAIGIVIALGIQTVLAQRNIRRRARSSVR